MNAPHRPERLKTRQQAAWASGDYAVIGTTLQIVGEQLAEACDLRTDERVLDVAAGNGNATLAAARRGCLVTSTDYVGSLLERGAERARAEGLQATFQVADAEALPFDDASFDAVLSTFGVMFSPDQARAAAELARVCRPGGRIGLANWTPEGFIGQVFKTLGRHLPPPAGVQPPSRWGVEAQPAHAVRRDGQRDLGDAAHLQLPLPLGGALHRGLPHLVRADPQGLRRAAGRRGAGARARPDRAADAPEPRGQRLAGGAQRVPRSGRHAALNAMAGAHRRAAGRDGAARSLLPRGRQRPRRGLHPLQRQQLVAVASADGTPGPAPTACSRRTRTAPAAARRGRPTGRWRCATRWRCSSRCFVRAGAPVTLVGHSYGGAVALLAALQQPGAGARAGALRADAVRAARRRSRPPNAADGIRADGGACTQALAAGDRSAAAQAFIDYWMGDGAWAAKPASQRGAIETAIANVQGWGQALFGETTPLPRCARSTCRCC